MFLNPFLPLTTVKVVALKSTVLILLTLLLKAKIRITAFSVLGFVLLLLLTLVFLVISTGMGLAACGAALYVSQQRRSAAP